MGALQDRAAELARAGYAIKQIEDETGLSYAGVRAALARRDARAIHIRDVDVRLRAESMPLREAVDYLLGVVEALLEARPRAAHPTDAWAHFPHIERRVVQVLFDAAGALLSREQLLSAVYFDAAVDEVPGGKIVDVFICKIRKKLPPHVVIATVWGRGWRMVVGESAGGASE